MQQKPGEDVAKNLETIKRKIAISCREAGRETNEVALVAISKGFEAARVKEAASHGVRRFGENRAREGLRKIEMLQRVGLDLEWDYVGHLQSNKVKYVVGYYNLIHSLDSPSLVREIDKRSAKRGIVSSCLVQVNVSGEMSKHGVSEEEASDLVGYAAGFDNLDIVGLMTIAPHVQDMEKTRPIFRRLRRLRDSIAAEEVPGTTMHHLSMGMTNDYPVAVEEGATLLRIGRGVFGPRG